MKLPEPVADVLARLELTAHKAGDDAAWLATITLPGKAAFESWKRLADACRGQGVWPVILGDTKEVGVWSDLAAERAENPFDKILAAADTVNLDAFLLSDDVETDDLPEPELGEWPVADEVGKQAAPAAVANFSGKPHARVTIALFQARQSWEVFARLPFGAWNDCPGAHAHVARHRDWQKRFGAEVCAITQDTVECFVRQPPMMRDAAIALANEQYKYCYDIVEQGTGTLAALAAGLLDSSLWFFWWD